MKTEFTLDFRDFNKKFTDIIQRAAPKSVQIGLREAGQELKLDADNIPPRTPHKEGFLRGSGKVSEINIIGKSAEVTVSYDKPYARRWHLKKLLPLLPQEQVQALRLGILYRLDTERPPHPTNAVLCLNRLAEGYTLICLIGQIR